MKILKKIPSSLDEECLTEENDEHLSNCGSPATLRSATDSPRLVQTAAQKSKGTRLIIPRNDIQFNIKLLETKKNAKSK